MTLALALCLGLPASAWARVVTLTTQGQVSAALMDRPHPGRQYRFAPDLRRRGEVTADWITVRNTALLANLRWVDTLSLRRSRLPGVGFLTRLSRLRRLDLGRSNVRSLAPLARLSRLRELILEGTTVRSLKPLARLTALREIDLSDTPVSDLSPLANRSLERLVIGHRRMRRLPRIAGLRVDKLVIDEADAALDLGPLGRARITTLVLDGTAVRGIAALAGHPTLRSVSLRRTGITVAQIRRLLARAPHLHVVTPRGRSVGRTVVWVEAGPTPEMLRCAALASGAPWPAGPPCAREYFGPTRRPVVRYIAP